MKKARKLILNKETLRALESFELKHLAGAAPTDLCVTQNARCNTEALNCNPSYTTCNSMYC
jgi:hypothetical protein